MAWVSGMLSLTIATLCLGASVARYVDEIPTVNVSRQERSSRCYGELGCFDTGGPFFSLYRPINFLPFSREAIDTRFYLYTRKNPKQIQTIKAGDAGSIDKSNFDAAKPTKMITHGFIQNGKVKWINDMKDAFLRQGDYNVINVDWGGGSLPPYTQATANTRLVGAEIALLINYLKDKFSAKPETFHLLGHSLGAHVMGYAGERVQYVGRISGLDPAGPYYDNTDHVVRLDPSDALFVDILHSNGKSLLQLGYGMGATCGHVDYFPNGGAEQPHCDDGPITNILNMGVVEGTEQIVACNHLRSLSLYTDSINSHCPFEGYRCDSYDSFQNGHCMPCTGTNCGYMGFHADKAKPPRGQSHVKYYLNTFGKAPFCGYHQQIQLSIGAGRTERGNIFIKLIGSTGQSDEFTLLDDKTDIVPATSQAYVVLTRSSLGDIKDIQIRWKHNSAWYKPFDWNLLGLRHPSINFAKITVISGEAATTKVFCDGSGPLETGKTRIVYSARSC